MTASDESKATVLGLSLRLLWFAYEAFRDAKSPDVSANALRQMRRYAAELGTLYDDPTVDDCAALCTAIGEVIDATLAAPTKPAGLADVLATALTYLRQRQHMLQDGEQPDAQVGALLPPIMAQLQRCGARTVTLPPMLLAAHDSGVFSAPRAAGGTGGLHDHLDHVSPALRRKFLAEMPEDVTQLRQVLLRLQEHPADEQVNRDGFHVAHKIRGSGGTMRWKSIAGLGQLLEDIFETLPTLQADPQPVLAVAMRLVDLLQVARDEAFRTGQEMPAALLEAQRLVQSLHLGGASPASAAAVTVVASTPPAAAPIPDTTRDEATAGLRIEAQRVDALLSKLIALSTRGQLMHSAGEDMANMLGELSRSVERALTRVQTIVDGDAKSPATAGAQEFTSSLKESVEDVGEAVTALRRVAFNIRQAAQEQDVLTAGLQQDLLHLRLVELSTLLPVIETTVRVVASEQGKRVRFTVRGGETAIDRDISDALAEPLYQLARNAVTHGIELPEARVALGKSPEGHVWLSAHHVGNEVQIEIGDDGKGVDLAHVRAAAIRASVIPPDAEPSAVNPGLIFEAGVTTWPQADLAAGRGVGLNQVRTAIHSFKGSIEMTSTEGQGTLFEVRIPVSLRVARVLLVEAGGQHYALPAAYLDRVIEAPDDIGTALDAGMLHVREGETTERIPMRSVEELLSHGRVTRPHHPVVVIVRNAGKRFALLVDQVGEQRGLMVRALPAYLRRSVTRSAAITAGGQVVLMLDIPTLHRRITGVRSTGAPIRQRAPGADAMPRVLIVDDSLSIRRTLSEELAQDGLEVETARDGIDALQTIARMRPRVLVLDIEMPRLDGFELLKMLRDSRQLEGVKVMMLTARTSADAQAHAKMLGADDYVIKPVPISELAQRIHKLLGTDDTFEANQT
ncbi:MAG TPA: response regulator [Ktedonobacterales bacterium]